MREALNYAWKFKERTNPKCGHVFLKYENDNRTTIVPIHKKQAIDKTL